MAASIRFGGMSFLQPQQSQRFIWMVLNGPAHIRNADEDQKFTLVAWVLAPSDADVRSGWRGMPVQGVQDYRMGMAHNIMK
jgi:hypothetical protein